ncbi:MAG TPA: type I methionyl aminopeptidase [Desulfomonilia bacterium]
MIPRKTPLEITKMRDAGRILAMLFEHIKPMVQPGITTAQLDSEAEKFIVMNNAKPAFKGYRGYPATLCTSVNDCIIHGIPGQIKLKEGDIIGLDVGVLFNGFYSDAAITLPVGEVPAHAKALMRTSEAAMHAGIEQAVPGNRLYDISSAIQKTAEDAGYSVVRDFVGHGIGERLHEEPQIPNYGKKGTGPLLETGMTLAIETMINQGTWKIRILKDKWTALTADGRLSAHFEHTIAITPDGPHILTAL